MVSIAAAALIGVLAGPPPQDRGAVPTTRAAYAACLRAAGRRLVADGRMDRDIRLQLLDACRQEEQALRAAMINADMAAGTKRADAEEGALFEVEDIVANVISVVRDEAELSRRGVSR